MKKENRKKIILAIVAVLLAIAALVGISYTPEEENTILNAVDSIVDIVDTIDTNNTYTEENPSSTEIPTEIKIEDEEVLEYQETEAESFELQGEIAYNGSSEMPSIQIGEYTGLTYFSQIDSRWKNKMYSSVGDSSQTIGSSGCGPTAAAMVVSSIRGNILPDEMSDLFVQYGYRSANNGTYWSAFRWTADVFDLEYQEKYKLDDVVELLRNNNYIIASCGNGLFTTGGHFIVLVGVEGDYIKVYDPYLYTNKFNTSTRRGKATVEGNTVYVTIENFREYANYKQFFCYKNDRTDIKENTTIPTTDTNTNSSVADTNYQARVTANTGLNIRSGASTSYPRVGGYAKNTIVTINAENNNWGKTDRGWICLQYVQKLVSSSRNTVGQIKRFSKMTYIYRNSNLSGTVYTYLPNTSVTVLENLGDNIDKVRVRLTGREGYVSINSYK